jgi:hypothetical protein
MPEEIEELRKLLATAIDYIDIMYGQITDQMVINHALLAAAKGRDPKFEEAYNQALRAPSAVDIRQKRSLQYPQLSEVIRSLKQ